METAGGYVAVVAASEILRERASAFENVESGKQCDHPEPPTAQRVPAWAITLLLRSMMISYWLIAVQRKRHVQEFGGFKICSFKAFVLSEERHSKSNRARPPKINYNA